MENAWKTLIRHTSDTENILEDSDNSSHPFNILLLIVNTLLAMAVFTYLQCRPPVDPPFDDPTYITVNTNGGSFQLGSNISIEIPAGALSAETGIAIGLLDSAMIDSIFRESGLTEKRLLVAFSATPSGLKFDLPVMVTLPCPPLGSGALPIHFSLNLEDRSYGKAPTHLLYDPGRGTITVFMNSFSTHAVAEVKDELSKHECSGDECRCGRVEVMESSSDGVYNNGDCQISRTDGYAVFLDCSGQPKEDWTFIEIDSNCVPELHIDAPAMIPTGSRSEIFFHVVLGDSGLADQKIQLDLSPVTLASCSPMDLKTVDGGAAVAVLTAGEKEGVVTISANADATFNTSFIAANGESFTGPQRYKRLKANADIEIVACPGAEDVFSRIQEAYDTLAEKYHFGSTWKITVEEREWSEEYTYQERVLLSERFNDHFEGEFKWGGTSEYVFTVPAPPPPFTCEEVSEYLPGFDGSIPDSTVSVFVEYLLFEKLTSAFDSSSVIPRVRTMGNGSHWMSKDASWYTNRYVLGGAFCLYDNPCPDQKTSFSGCALSDVAHSVDSYLYFDWLPGGQLYVRLQKNQNVDSPPRDSLSQTVTFDTVGFDISGVNDPCIMAPVCLGSRTHEESYYSSFNPVGINSEDSIPFFKGAYEFSDTSLINDNRRKHTTFKKVTLDCIAGCD